MTHSSDPVPTSKKPTASSTVLNPLHTDRLSQSGDTETILDAYYQEVRHLILSRQTPIVGLLPASTAITVHGDYTDAWVRDNVYSILAVWGLALAYRKVDEGNRGRAYELEHSVIKLMRGLLVAMMRQASKVEQFKETQAPLDALHAKYHSQTGEPVVGDAEWGHLQLDATSLFLLMLAQMTTSGLAIIQTLDEVDFVQNLVYYIGRTYRTPDYGIWERGNKTNHGKPELNASSVGMAKAALEAMSGLNLFGMRGGPASVIYVLPDEIARARITLESLLPRESGSKEVDGALLSIIGFPAFAVDDPTVAEKTREKIITKLQGRYGCKRFLRDGHQTVIEDISRLHYEPGELQQFEHIECEWPLFFTYLLLDAIFRGDRAAAQSYRTRLDHLLVKDGEFGLLPELYYVPKQCIDAEREDPSSQARLPNENVPLVWAQSLYLLGRMLQDELISIGDIDPLGQHQRLGQRRRPIVQVALLAENEDLQAELACYGIATQTPQQLESVQIRSANKLSALYTKIGENHALKLTGRPERRLRSLTTSRFFQIRGERVVFLPAFLDAQQFYLTLDYHFLVAQIKGELAYIYRHWHSLGRPTVTLLLTQGMFEMGHAEKIEDSPVLGLMKQLRDGDCEGTPVRLGALHQLVLTAKTERIALADDVQLASEAMPQASRRRIYLHCDRSRSVPLSQHQEFFLERETDEMQLIRILRQSTNLYEHIEVLENLVRLKGLSFDTKLNGPHSMVTLRTLLNEVYEQAAQWELWAIIRRAAGVLEKVDIALSDAVTDIVIRQKQISVGKSYSQASLITEPTSHEVVMEKIKEFCGEDVRDRPLTQELLIYLSVLIKTNPALFDGLLTLRVGYLILLITSAIAEEQELSQDEAYETLMRLSPFDVKSRLLQVLEGYGGFNQTLFKRESLHLRNQGDQPVGIQWQILPESIAAKTDEELEPVGGSWRKQRQRDGALNMVPKDFYPNVWQLLHHCKGVVIGDKLERRNRLDSQLMLSDTTPEEKDFALRVEHLLNKIQAPEYRQLTVEALAEVAALVKQNPDLHLDDNIVFDVLVGHAVRLSWLDRHTGHDHRYHEEKANAWQAFYEMSPRTCAQYTAKALQFLTDLGTVAPLSQSTP
ncbi:MAG: glycoside hydrolase family 15 protein [Cyanobacteria bacterium P01_F01_bin.150]